MKIVSLSEVSNEQAAEWLVDLSEDLRSTDLDEIKASTGEEPAVALVSSVLVSTHAWVILDRGDPICAFGAAPGDQDGDGVVWMLGSPRMDEPHNAIGILRLSQRYLQEMHGAYPRLFNYIDARNDRSMKWLEWCGFEVIDVDLSHGIEGRPFYHFSRQRHV